MLCVFSWIYEEKGDEIGYIQYLQAMDSIT
jgi:hypothetical protein